METMDAVDFGLNNLDGNLMRQGHGICEQMSRIDDDDDHGFETEF